LSLPFFGGSLFLPVPPIWCLFAGWIGVCSACRFGV